MKTTCALFRDFIGHALDHPDGPRVAKAFERVMQFDLEDSEPFYMEVKGGLLTVHEGDSGLDWKYKDWERATCVYTTTRVIQQIALGERLASEAFFDHELGFAGRRGTDRHTSADDTVAWFFALIRLAHEQIDAASRRKALAGLAEA